MTRGELPRRVVVEVHCSGSRCLGDFIYLFGGDCCVGGGGRG